MTVKCNPISSEDNFQKGLLSDIIHCVTNRINKKNTEMWKKGFDEIQHPIMIKKKKENSQKNNNRRSHPQLDNNLQKNSQRTLSTMVKGQALSS